MIVDVHAHAWTSPEQLGPAAYHKIQNLTPSPEQHLDAGPSARHPAMANVDWVILHGLAAEQAGAKVRTEDVAMAIDAAPEKTLGFAGIDPIAAGPRANELIDHAKILGMVGITICPAAASMHPCHTRAMALYERCEHEKLPVFVLGSSLFGNAATMPFAQPEQFDQIARDFPNLHLVMGEVGRPWIEPVLTLISNHPHMYASIDGLIGQPWMLYQSLLLADQYRATEKLLFASGFPFCTPKMALVNLYSVNQYAVNTHLPHISRRKIRNIVERNALACLGLESHPVNHPPETSRVKLLSREGAIT